MFGQYNGQIMMPSANREGRKEGEGREIKAQRKEMVWPMSLQNVAAAWAMVAHAFTPSTQD